MHPAGWGEFHDPEHLSTALAQVDVRAVQLSAGTFHATLGLQRFDRWSLQHVGFVEGTSSCAGSAAPDRHALLVPLALGRDSRLLGQALGTSEIGVYAPGAEHADVSNGGLVEVVLMPPADLLEDAAERGEGVDLPRRGSSLWSVPAAELATLRRTLISVRNAPPGAAAGHAARAIADELEIAVVSALQAAGDQSAKGRPALPRRSILRQVAEALYDDEDETMHVTELARSVGVSYSTLRRIFFEWFGTSPVHYLLLKRLYLARRRLVSGESRTVSDAAMSCGFWELGRFAQRYRILFGERPSETLSRAVKPDQ